MKRTSLSLAKMSRETAVIDSNVCAEEDSWLLRDSIEEVELADDEDGLDE